MTVLGQGNGSSFPSAIDTAEQQIDGAAGTAADANYANDVTAAIVALETALGTNPAGSMTNVASRLSTLIATAGGITAGTTANRPTAATGTYRLYWNTTLNRLELIKDDASVTAIAGVTDHGGLTGLTNDNHTQYLLANGSRNATGDVVIEKASPSLQLKGTETSAKNVRWYENAGTLYLQEYTGGTWTTRASFDMGTGEFTVNAQDVNAYDTTNSVAVSLVTHAGRHKKTGNDPAFTMELYWNNASGVGGDYGLRNSSDGTNNVPVAFWRPFLPPGGKTVNFKGYAVSGNQAIPGDVAGLGFSVNGVSGNVTAASAWGLLASAFPVTASGSIFMTVYTFKSHLQLTVSGTDAALWIT